jgi:hypothetical protein
VPLLRALITDPALQVAWRGLGAAGGASRWRASTLLSLRNWADTTGIHPLVVAADAAATPDGLRVLLMTANGGDGGRRHLYVVAVKGDPTAVSPGVEGVDCHGVWQTLHS